MTKSEVEAAARAVGLVNPRVIPFLKLTQVTVWRLWHGKDRDRVAIELPVNPAADLVERALELARAA